MDAQDRQNLNNPWQNIPNLRPWALPPSYSFVTGYQLMLWNGLI